MTGAASQQNGVSPRHIRCNMTPIRRANATMARFAPRRFATRVAHVLNNDDRPRWIMIVAA
jgi:hypothetical protein